LHLIERVLDMGGRCAVIVPDGVLFGSSKQHQEIRKKIIEDSSPGWGGVDAVWGV
jgi:type I restriction enzyme M protein